jgi:hypothetical protein
MAADSYGPKNEPNFSSDGAPSDAADLTQIAEYAANVGNRKAGLNSVRIALTGADMWEGLEFLETDTGQTFRVIGGAWQAVGVRLKGVTPYTSGQWATTSNTVFSTTVAVVAGHWYKIDVNVMAGQVSVTGTPNLNITVGTTVLDRLTAGVAFTVGEVASPLIGFSMWQATSTTTVVFGVTGSTSGGAFRPSGGNVVVTDLGSIY